MNTEEVVEINPKKMSGTAVFRGTRVPITHLFEYLEGGETVDEFLDQFPTVTRAQVLRVFAVGCFPGNKLVDSALLCGNLCDLGG